MKRIMYLCAVTALTISCQMNNPLLTESTLPYEAPQFDKIKTEHYLPAFKAAIAEAKAEIDAITSNPEEPTFENTVEALEFSGKTLDRVASIFYNLMEADTNDEMQAIAEEISPMMTEFSMYVSLNDALFERIKAVYSRKDSLGLDPVKERLLEKKYKGFVRSGANLSEEDKKTYSKLEEELSLKELEFSKNLLGSTNEYKLNLKDESDIAGLPQFALDMAAETAKENGQEGWTFDLSAPSYGAFMKYSTRRDLRKDIYMAYNTRGYRGDFNNSETVRQIVELRMKIANILGYPTWADYVLEERMAKSRTGVENFLSELLEPTIPAAKKDIAELNAFAKENGFEDSEIMPWDMSFWSTRYKDAKFSLSDEQVKPYFQLESCIDAVLGLATKLYGISFEERSDIPAYHKDVKVFDVKDSDGSHLALFYADFFPRASKRSGAWMTEFRGASIQGGIETRPLISIVTNFSKPSGDEPSLLTHDELNTFLHEFGHALHGILGKGEYGSMTGTNVDHDFVELPSQIMENWCTEAEWLNSFAKHYKTGETIPSDIIDNIIASQNYLAAYYQIRQLKFGTLDMAWYTLTQMPECSIEEFESAATARTEVLPAAEGTCTSTSFSHIFPGGYSAGYYSYKWAEVLEADAFSLFKEKGIFNPEVSGSFRENILSKGSSEDEAELYRRFRGHDPKPQALLEKLGIIPAGNPAQ